MTRAPAAVPLALVDSVEAAQPLGRPVLASLDEVWRVPAWAGVAAAGRLVVLDADFLGVTAYEAATGEVAH